MSRWTPWTWSQPHGRHYSYLLAVDNTILDTVWAGPTTHSGATNTSTALPTQAPAESIQHTPNVPSRNLAVQTRSNQPTTRGFYFETNVRRDEDNNHDEEEEEEDNHDEEEEEEEEEDDGDDSDQTQLRATVHHRVDSANAALAESLNNLDLRSSNSGHRPQGSYTGSTYSHQPSNQPRPYVYSSSSQSQPSYYATTPASAPQTSRIASLPAEVQAHIGYLDRRFITTGNDQRDTEQLDPRFRRVARSHHAYFFVLGRVFKMLWTEPAGQANPGRTRNSTHFSTVRFGEQAFSEKRRFVVVRNKGSFSQCIPIQTYKGQGATKPGIVMQDHGVIHTSVPAPNLLPGENLNKYSIQVIPTATEILEPQSRVNYGKAYAVEHNVKVLDIGMVMEGHKYLIQGYFDSAMRGQ